MNNIKKISAIILVHLIEFVVLYFVCSWLWNSVSSEVRLWYISGTILVYILYFVVTTMNDYREIKYGIESRFF